MAQPFTRTGEFGCGAAGLSGFFGSTKDIEEHLKKWSSPLVFAVLTQEQQDAIKAFENLGGYCAAQCYNHRNTVGLYVLVNYGTNQGRKPLTKGHNVQKPILVKAKKKRGSFKKWWSRTTPTLFSKKELARRAWKAASSKGA